MLFKITIFTIDALFFRQKETIMLRNNRTFGETETLHYKLSHSAKLVGLTRNVPLESYFQKKKANTVH